MRTEVKAKVNEVKRTTTAAKENLDSELFEMRDYIRRKLESKDNITPDDNPNNKTIIKRTLSNKLQPKYADEIHQLMKKA